MLPQQLPAAAARHQHVALSRRRRRSATSRPPPVACSVGDQAALGAQRQRRTTRSRRCSRRPIRPSSTSAAAPDRELGVRRVGVLHRLDAAARSASQSIGELGRSALDVRLAVGGRRLDPADQPGHREDRGEVGQHRQEVRRDRDRRADDARAPSAARSAKPNSSAAATAPRGLQRPKITAASAMKPLPEVMFLLNAPTEPIVRNAPPRPAIDARRGSRCGSACRSTLMPTVSAALRVLADGARAQAPAGAEQRDVDHR